MSAHGSGLPRHICRCAEPHVFNNGFMLWCGRCGGIARYVDRIKMMNEDQLPSNMTDDEYDKWFAQSKVIDGVRMGPEVKKDK